MRIYQAEKDAGIDFQMNEAGSSSSFITARAHVCEVEKYFDGMSVADLSKATETVQTVKELLGQEQPDLALIVAILVSTGWNDNDDIFTPEEVWKARLSPLHKPMNDNHNAEKILGHIVQSRALDKSGNEIELGDDGSLPSEFDIEVAGVLYRAFPELAKRIDEIIAKANTGEIFVSMEAWFPDFGYGLIDPNTGETKLLERTEATAFLTKHLRIYGGSGEYQGYKIGRVLTDIIFGAQGFVDTPANPESVIKVAANKVATSSQVFVTAKLSELLEGGVDDVDEKQLKELQENLESKTKEVVELQKAAKDYDGQIAVLTTKVEELTIDAEKLGVTMAERDQAIEAKVELQKQLNEATSLAEKSKAELEEIRKNEAARDRMVKLLEVKKVEDEKATLAELREMTDETFELILKYAGEVKTEDVVDDKSNTTEGKTEAELAEAALNKVEVDNSADFSTTEDVQKSEADLWVSAAKALCGREDKQDEGGE